MLEADLKTLQKELAVYSDNDPEELERKEKETTELRAEVTKYTDDIQTMESWFKKHGLEQQLSVLQMSCYGDEWDTEEYDFKEV